MKLNIWKRIKEWFTGHMEEMELISTEHCVQSFALAINTIDKDKDGMISVDEIVNLFREMMRNVKAE